jgi:hypothetical protein
MVFITYFIRHLQPSKLAGGHAAAADASREPPGQDESGDAKQMPIVDISLCGAFQSQLDK